MNDVCGWRSEFGNWRPVNASGFYARKAPNLFNFVTSDDGLRAYFLQEVAKPEVGVPEQDIYFAKDAYVSDLPLIYDSEGKILSISMIDHGGVETQNGLTLGEFNGPIIDRPAAFLFKAGKNNYGHILAEMLPKCELLVAAGLVDLTIILPTLPGNLAQQIKEIIHTVYGPSFSFLEMPGPLVQVRELIVPGPVTKHNTQKSHAVLSFAERMNSAFGCKGSASEQIYVSRREIRNRRMLNEAEIETTVERLGFKIVHPERMTIREQVELFSRATTVCGPLGAGLANTMFSPHHAHIIMVSPGMYDFFFYDLAGLCGQTFTWVFSNPLKQFDISVLHTDYICDAAAVRGALTV